MAISRWFSNPRGEKWHPRRPVYPVSFPNIPWFGRWDKKASNPPSLHNHLMYRRTSRRLRYYILLAIIIGAGYTVLFSTFFSIKEIIVEGNRTLVKEDIIE